MGPFDGRVLIAALALVAGIALAACGGSGPGEEEEAALRDAKLVGAYCLFRSDTKAQLLDCQTRVDASQVRARDDAAARWARRELHGCPAVAGELCGDLYRGVWEKTIERELR
jgi:hypothetical protein